MQQEGCFSYRDNQPIGNTVVPDSIIQKRECDIDASFGINLKISIENFFYVDAALKVILSGLPERNTILQKTTCDQILHGVVLET
jgi:hypothetical protein